MDDRDAANAAELTDQVKKFALGCGASLVGIAPAESFQGAPRGHRPADFVNGARSVVVVGVRLLDSIVGWDRLFRDSEVYTEEIRIAVAQHHLYGRSGYETMNQMTENLGLRIALYLEGLGQKSMYFPATFAHHAPIMEKIPGYLAPFSHRHAAVLAGLGEFGLNNLVLTPEYGPRARFMSVITRAPLKPDPLIKRKICLGLKCSLCVKKCGVNGLKPLDGLDDGEIFIDMPSTVDKAGCYFKHKHGVDCWGWCIDACPIGKK